MTALEAATRIIETARKRDRAKAKYGLGSREFANERIVHDIAIQLYAVTVAEEVVKERK